MKYSEALRQGIASDKYVQETGTWTPVEREDGKIGTCAGGVIGLELGLSQDEVSVLLYCSQPIGDWETFRRVIQQNDEGESFEDIAQYLEEQGL